MALYRTFPLKSGVVAHRWEIESPRAILVLQHGFSEYARRYFDGTAIFVPRLQAQGFEIWALDLWAHGDSPGLPRSVIDCCKAVQDLIEIQETAIEARPLLPLYLFGHSLGGLLTACSVVGNSLPIDGVILCAAALQKPMPLLRRGLVQPLAMIWGTREIPFTKQSTNWLSRVPTVVEKAIADPNIFHGAISYRLAATALEAAERLWQATPQWNVPTLVIHGTADTYTDHHQSRQFVERISSTDKELYLIEGGYHELFRDKCSEIFTEKVEHWLVTRLRQTVKGDQ
ncbi:alpha/beta-hydrolase [Penicillium verhagenii]|uniref:alpha/beta-hydrolase n=1 Tax=Penicillium verhagenii TaxID=1562060 RepID=UPI002544EC5B|nr:alpha/beta-hydrolase [Penicillium verhagenii]KAJ5947270.1 alpha/beta-hydrolase [Penicillium verhagenii]